MIWPPVSDVALFMLNNLAGVKLCRDFDVYVQVGAAIYALCRASRQNLSGQEGAQCTSLKANMGHLEACAAAGGLASLVVTALTAGVVATNAQLRRFGACRVFDWVWA